jgi:zinc and cadmium transporter
VLLGTIIFFSLLGSLGAVVLSGLFLLFPNRIQNTLIPGLISYATGTLLGTAFLGMIPHALEHLPVPTLALTLLLGILLFFILEKFVVWRHCHSHSCEVHEASGPLILIGDSFHSFVDGILIAGAFLSSYQLGIVTAVSVIFHEVPQEVGDFAILLKNKYSKKKAFGLNIISGLSSVAGAVLAYILMDQMQFLTPYVMGIAASSFIYIALADLIPDLHNHVKFKESLIQVILLSAGIFTIYLMASFN